MKSDKDCLVELCQHILNGRRSIIESSREVARLYHILGPEGDPDFLVFVGIYSETDHLPIGPEKKYWHKDALEQKTREINDAETLYRAAALRAAANLISKHTGL